MQKNVVGTVTVLAIDTATNLPKTGDSANITLYYNGDNAGVTIFSTGSGHPSEDDATNSPGTYTIANTAAESNFDKICVSGKSSTSGIRIVPVLNVATTPANFASAYSPARSGTAQAGGSTSITLDASASATDNFYAAGSLVYVYAGTGAGQARVITAYVGSTKVATVDAAWATNPDSTSKFAVFAGDSAGSVNANVASINNISTSSVTTVNANIGTTQPVNFTGTGGSALAKSDMVDIAGSAVSASTAQLGVNVVNFGGSAGTFSSGKPSVKLASTDVTGNVAADLQTIKTQAVTCAAGVTVGVFVGNATAAIAVTAAGGVTLGDGVAHGGTLGSSTATLALSRLSVVSQSSNTTAFTVTGNGTGNGATFTSGAGVTGNGVSFISASTNGNGMSCTGTGTGNGILGTGGNGTNGDGMHLVAGTGASVGLRAIGGGTSGEGALFIATAGNANGATFTHNGGGFDLSASITDMNVVGVADPVQVSLIDPNALDQCGLTLGGGAVVSSTSNTVTFTPRVATTTPEVYRGGTVVVYDDADDEARVGQPRLVTDAADAGGGNITLTVSKNWEVNPTNTNPDHINVFSYGQADLQTIKDQSVTCAAGVTVGAFVGNATHALAVDSSGAITLPAIPNNWITAAGIASGAFVVAVWDGAISGHTTSGTFGGALNSASSAGDPWNTDLPGAYAAGTAGSLVGNSLTDTGSILDATGLDGVTVASTINARQALAVILAAEAGKTVGAGTGTFTISQANSSSDAIVATVSGGNRSAVTITPPA